MELHLNYYTRMEVRKYVSTLVRAYVHMYLPGDVVMAEEEAFQGREGIYFKDGI